MIGDQEGSQTDYGLTFRKQILAPRVFAFLALGVLLFLCVSYWPRIKPYLTRPGFWPLISGGLAVLASITLMHWFDQAGNGKFGAVSD
ncbi:MAG: hypothetical protein JOY78_15970, partial [Pseudonocardia sp.]|nr:hypothetical protein [Pseudonocardia sp.]